MFQIPMPNELIKTLFGEYVAENFNTISLVLFAIGFIIFIARKKQISKPKEKQDEDYSYNTQKQETKRWDYTDPTSKPRKSHTTKPENEPNWYPTGWTWNEEKQLWEPPDYLSQESHDRWEWNETSRIWVDKSQMNKEANAKKREEVKQNWNKYQQNNAPKPKVHLTEEEKELARKIHVEREKISFEEWKAAKQAEKNKDTTYHYKKDDIEQN